jgi:hypothetical protein
VHYRNGREAKVGDRVVGRCYNTTGLVSGTLVSLTPGPDTCSAMVGFLETRVGSTPLAWGTCQPVIVQGTEQHGAKEPLAATMYKQDFTECKNLLHVEDVAADGALLAKP